MQLYLLLSAAAHSTTGLESDLVERLSSIPRMHTSEVGTQLLEEVLDERRRLATTCSDLWETCTNGCGAEAVFPCTDLQGNCTPFSFMPNISNQNCPDWMDNGFWKSSPFFEDSDVYAYQAWQASGFDDVWVQHGCNGAGIQTDCIGDVMYLEHFDSRTPVAGQDCPLSDKSQENNIMCPTFWHPGLQQSYPGYSCGWWRGYENSGDANVIQAHGDGIGFLGPTDSGTEYTGNYWDQAYAALANCPTCSYGTATETPYREPGANAYFIGGVWPWICTDGWSGMEPYTGSSANCFCDNEPRNGRQKIGGGTQPLMPSFFQVVYCGLYDGPVLKCDFIGVDGENGYSWLMSTAVDMDPSSFP